MIRNDIEFYVFSYDRLATSMEKAKIKKRAKVHLEVETGTNRTGMTEPFSKSLTLSQAHQEHFLFRVCTTWEGQSRPVTSFGSTSSWCAIKIPGGIEQAKDHAGYRHIACSAAVLACRKRIMTSSGSAWHLWFYQPRYLLPTPSGSWQG